MRGKDDKKDCVLMSVCVCVCKTNKPSSGISHCVNLTVEKICGSDDTPCRQHFRVKLSLQPDSVQKGLDVCFFLTFSIVLCYY